MSEDEDPVSDETAEARRYHFGWKPDIPDHRDQKLKIAPSRALPDSVNLRKYCSVVENQLSIGSCTAHAATSCVELLYNKKKAKSAPQLSRLFVYYASRVWVSGWDPYDDSGAYNRDVVKALSRYGVCLEALWPYDAPEEHYGIAPPEPAKAEAYQRKITGYFRCDSLEAILGCLADGYPLLGGFSVPANMMTATCARSGRVKFPSPTERILGGHAVMFMGYSKASELLTFQNSWGTGWGANGYGYLPFSFVEKKLAADFWTIRAGEQI